MRGAALARLEAALREAADAVAELQKDGAEDVPARSALAKERPIHPALRRDIIERLSGRFARRREWSRKGFIYIVRAEGTGLVKIGFASNLARRLSDHACSSPVRLALVYKRAGTMEDERSMHRLYAEHRSHREWFREEGMLASLLKGAST